MHKYRCFIICCVFFVWGCGKGAPAEESESPESKVNTETKAKAEKPAVKEEEETTQKPIAQEPEKKPETVGAEVGDTAEVGGEKSDDTADDTRAGEAEPDTGETEVAAEESTDEPQAAAASPEGIPPLETPFILKREGVHIATLILARGVEKNEDGKRMPVEPGNTFIRDDRRVFAIVDLENPAEIEGELKVGWIKPGSEKESGVVSLTVKAKKSWRTWAFNKYVNKESGVWQVVIRDSDDTVLGRAAFEMKK